MNISGLLKIAAVSLLAVGLAAPVAAPANTDEDAVARKFIGVWRLIRIEGTGKGTAPGDHPIGYISYDTTGHMAVQEDFDAERPGMARGPNGPSAEEKATAYDDYAAYFGTYTVDAKAGTITHHVEGSITPGRIGSNNVRYFDLVGNRVTLYDAAVVKGVLEKKEDTVRRLIWERVDP